MVVLIVVASLLVLAVIIGFTVIMVETLTRKGRWGINLDAVYCPGCGKQQPTIRKPLNLRQALWGGWSCNSCGCELDKWGKEIINKKD